MLCITADSKQLSERGNDETKQNISRCLSELEGCLREVLSEVLEVEMKAAYDDLWREVKSMSKMFRTKLNHI